MSEPVAMASHPVFLVIAAALSSWVLVSIYYLLKIRSDLKDGQKKREEEEKREEDRRKLNEIHKKVMDE